VLFGERLKEENMIRTTDNSIRSSVSERIPVYRPDLSGNERRYVLECIDSSWISSIGSFIDRFEFAAAEAMGASHAIALCNGTVALHLALHCLNMALATR
jgi:perosamine synthetase